MKILHVNTNENAGGAARAAHRLYLGQRAAGLDARMAVMRRTTRDPNVEVVPMSRLRRLIYRRMAPRETPSRDQYPGYNGVTWSAGRVSLPVPAYVAGMQPDIVNLHWVGGGFLSVETIARLSRPMVWTLHDMWALTGGCHYAGDCLRFQTGCGACPQLGSADAHDMSHATWARKSKDWGDLDLTLVTPSRWLADIARTSPFLGRYRIEVIPNGLDMQIFRPFDAMFARDVLNLPQDKKLILFGAHRIDDTLKGFTHLVKALHALPDKDGVELVLFGSQQPPLDVGLKTHHVGVVDNDRLLALLYAAADIFVAPSVQDNLPNTIMEALACGTPCAAFNIGGMRDMIDHQQSGYLAQPFDADDLARGIAWVLENRLRLSIYARAETAARFNLPEIAARYQALYTEILRG